MWILGGFVSGSAVAVWAGLGPITAALLGYRRAALGLAAGYALLMAASGLVPTPAAPVQPAWLREGLFALNLAAVPLVGPDRLLGRLRLGRLTRRPERWSC